jgi:hypothetical protein
MLLEKINLTQIPLLEKLKDDGCLLGDFILCDELLACAMSNRTAWEARGGSVVEELVQQMESQYGPSLLL